MAISTPKTRKGSLDKLYGYLKGYEIPCFTGSPKSEVIKSTVDLMRHECKVLFPDNTKVLESITTKVIPRVDRYLTKFYSRMSSISNSLKVKDLAEKAKKDSKMLSKLISVLVQGGTTPLDCLGYSALNTRLEATTICDICEKCPWYIKPRFCLIFSRLEDDGDISAEMFSLLLPESRYLALSLLLLTRILLENGVELNNLTDYYMLYNHILTNSKIFECMNPSGEARLEQVNDTIDLLTSQPLDRSSEKYQYYLSVLEEVFSDIREGKKRYIRDISEALKKNESFTHSKYDYDNDCYLSIRGTGQSRYTKERKSLVSSAFEVDYYKDLFKEFDEYVGFESYYADATNLDLEADQVYCIRTIMINNPGKYKGRIIHIFDNPIQDRVNYIHRRLKRILDDMSCDCTTRQNRGRQFLKECTNIWYLTTDSSQKQGIYAFDFSNATDTLDQFFQEKVLEFVFGPEIASFWTQVSSLPKFYQNPVDNSWNRYDQFCGQPQGGLGSFDGFALAHHFIFLMDMKLLGLENCSSRDFYRVLGDDSVCCSIQPEQDLFDPNDCWVDPEGISRSILEHYHIDICTNFAGFKVNYDKSDAVHWNSSEAKLDFAKVTYRNGKFFSPIPFRLAMRFSHDTDSKFAVAIWRGEMQESNADSFMELVLEDYQDPLIKDIVRSGEIHYLASFKDNRIYNSSWLARLRYSYTICSLTQALYSLTITDKMRDHPEINPFQDAWDAIFTPQEVLRLDKISPNHKIFRVLSRNEEILLALKDIYEFDRDYDQIISLLTSPAFKGELQSDFLDQLHDLSTTSKVLRLAKANPEVDVSEIFPDFDFRWRQQLTQLSNSFTIRSTTRRPVEEVTLFVSILDTLRQLDDVLGSISATL